MSKLEVQSLSSLVLGVVDVVDPFTFSKARPCFEPSLVSANVVELDRNEEEDVECRNAEEDSVAGVV